MTKSVRTLSICTFAVISACGDSTATIADDVTQLDDFGVAEQNARVTQQQAQLAAQLVDSTRAYLPFAYTEDGCYARALYMSMELASRRVPGSFRRITFETQDALRRKLTDHCPVALDLIPSPDGG